MDEREQLAILESLARDPTTPARERVAALRLFREVEATLPREGDGEVASMEAFMERRGSDRPPREGRGGELLPPGP